MKNKAINSRLIKGISVLYLLICIIACLSASALAADNAMTASDYSALADDMSEKYDHRMFVMLQTENTADISKYQYSRLIVKADSVPNDESAIEISGGYRGIYLMQYSSPVEAYIAQKRLSDMDGIEYAEPDAPIRAQSLANGSDTYVYNSDGAKLIGANNFNKTVMTKYGCVDDLPEVKVVVMDTGVDSDHSFLLGRLISYDVEDKDGHGTHVCGIIADLTLPNVKIISYSIDGKSFAQVTAAMYSFGEEGILAFNMSFKLLNVAPAESQSFTAAVEGVYDDYGTLSFIAAGNDSKKIDSSCYPANIAKGVTISNYTGTGLAQSSNYGSEVDFTAPGTYIYSAYRNGGYTYMSGTSMAAPHALSVAAMIYTYEYDGTLKTGPRGAALLELMKNNSIDLGDKGKDDKFGYGLVSFKTYEPEPVREGTCGENLTFSIDENGAMSISGSGEMYDYKKNGAPWNGARSEIVSVEIGSGVTSIGSAAFYLCSALETLTVMGSTLTSVGDDAFSDCNALNCVFYGGNKTAWSNIEIGTSNDALTTASIHYEASGHTYGNAVFTWAKDYSSATAKIVCPFCTDGVSGHSIEGKADISTDVLTPASCKQNGATEYTATIILNEQTYTDTKTVNTDKLQHTIVVEPAVTATKRAEGKTEKHYCSVCGDVLLEPQTISKLTDSDENEEKIAVTVPDNATESINNIPTDVFNQQTDAHEIKPVTVDLGDFATLCFDSDAVSSIFSHVGDEAFSLRIAKSDTEGMEKTLSDAGIENAKAVITLELKNSDNADAFSEGDSSGSVKVTVSYTTEDSSKTVIVYYLKGTEKTRVPAEYKNGKLTLTINHFSDYVIVEHEHTFKNPEFIWNNHQCTARFSCDCGESEELSCTVSSSVTKKATSRKNGLRTYTATVKVGDKTYIDSSDTEVIPATGDNGGGSTSSIFAVLLNLLKSLFSIFAS